MTTPSFDSNAHTPATDDARRDGHQVVASFPDYLQAQALVDRMSDDGFPVEHVRIIGDGVRMVEQVTGRITLVKAALGGSASGAWFGLLIGLLFGLFTIGPAAWLTILLGSLVLGAVWGAIFGSLAHWLTQGQRDFSSVMTLSAQRYDVCVDADYATQASKYRTV